MVIGLKLKTTDQLQTYTCQQESSVGRPLLHKKLSLLSVMVDEQEPIDIGIFHLFLAIILFFQFVTEKDVKMQKEMIFPLEGNLRRLHRSKKNCRNIIIIGQIIRSG